jgi:DNA invertase Pin-like site-specific DNA recombinase
MPTMKQRQIYERRKQVLKLFLDGCSQVDIAKKLNVTRQTIHNDLEAIVPQGPQIKFSDIEKVYWDLFLEKLKKFRSARAMRSII